MSREFSIKITIDGSDARRDAKRIRDALEAQLSGVLELKELASDGVNVTGQVEIAGLEEAHQKMVEIREAASGLGRAVAAGLGRQADALERHLIDLQSRITGLVRYGEQLDLTGKMLEDMPEIEQAMTEGTKRAIDAAVRLQKAQAGFNETLKKTEELRRTVFTPLGGGKTYELGELFELLEPGSGRKIVRTIKRIRKDAAEELEKLEGDFFTALEKAQKAADRGVAGLVRELEELRSAMAELQQARPAGSMYAPSPELTKWTQQIDVMQKQHSQLESQISQERQRIIDEGTRDLREALDRRQRAIQRELAEETPFWREMMMGGVEEIAAAFRASGQSAVAQALEQLSAAREEMVREQVRVKRAFGVLQKGAQAELKEGAEGTMVDFISAERTLANVATEAEEALKAQWSRLGSLTKRLDEARMAAEGFSKAEREALTRLEKVAGKKMTAAIPLRKDTDLEESAERARAVLAELAVEATKVGHAMEAALSEPEDEVEETPNALVRAWRWAQDKLVGHSIVPDTAEAIIAHLERVKQEARQSTAVVVDDARRLADKLGISWEQVEHAVARGNRDYRDVVRILRQIDDEQRRVERGANRIRKEVQESKTAMARFLDELSKARTRTQGIQMLTNDIQRVGQSIRFTSAALTGSLVLAGRSYLDLARQTDIASRSLLLNDDLTQQLRHDVVALSSDLALLDPQQTAEGVTVWAQATGQAVDSTEDLQNVLQQTIPVQQLAALTQSQIGTVTDGAAATLRQFGLTLDDTTRVVAIFNKVSDDTLAEVGDMAEAFKYVGPQAKEMGESVESAAAVLGIMADQNIRGSTAGRAYRQMLLSLVNPTKKAREALEDAFGTDQPFFDAEGQFVGMVNVIDMLAAATENASDEQRDLLLSTLFTSNAIPAVTTLVEAQTEAREKGINAARAQMKLLDGVVDAEVKAYAQMRREADGTTVAMMSAMDLWEKQLDDWEESDVYRVQQAEMRWKGFWLAVGESAVNTALPYLEKGADVLEKVTAHIQGEPMLSGLIGLAVGGTALGTLLTTVVTVTRTVHGLQTLSQAVQATLQGQQQASSQFQGQVVTAAERFQAIIIEAAQQAAATEQTGAEAETAIENEGAVAESAIENEGAVTESAIEAESAIAEATIEAEGAIAESAIEAAGGVAAGAGGATAAGGAAAAGGIGIGTLALGGMAATLGLAVGGAFNEALSRLFPEGPWVGTGEVASVAAYKAGELLGGEEQGLAWFQAVAEAFGEIPPKAEDATQAVDQYGQAMAYLPAMMREGEIQAEGGAGMVYLPTVMREYEDEAKGATSATQALINSLYQMGQAGEEAAKLTDEQIKAGDLYAEMTKKMADATQNLNDALSQAYNDLNADLAQMAVDHRAQIAQLNEDYNEESTRRTEEYNRQHEKAQRDHEKKMRRMYEDHQLRMSDLARSRDAYGMRKEEQQYRRQKKRAEEDFRDAQAEAAEQFQRELELNRQQHEERMAELAAQYEEEREERLATYEEREAELKEQHRKEQEEIRRHYFDKINEELGYYSLSERQQSTYHNAMLAEAQTFLKNNQALWANHLQEINTMVANASVGGDSGNPHTGPYDTYQSGGYVPRTGLAGLHRGEFVLTPETTHQIEAHLGPLTQDRLVAGLAGRGGRGASIQANVRLSQDFRFHGSMSASERQWFRDTARIEAEQAFTQALRKIQDM